MGPDAATSERRLIQQLVDTLREIPGAQAHLAEIPYSKDWRPDALIDASLSGGQVCLAVEAKRELYPRDVREVLWQLHRYFGEGPARTGRPLLPLIAAESLSPGARDFLKSQQVGYFDSGGSLFLPAPGAFVYIERPLGKTMARSIRSLFTGQRARAMHVLLNRPREWIAGNDLAQEAQVSPATASQVMTELERLDWLTVRGQGPNKERSVKDPGGLLDSWVQQLPRLPKPTRHRYFVPSLGVDPLARRLGPVLQMHDVQYVVSYEAAAQRYAPFVSSISQLACRARLNPELDGALADFGARKVTEGANLIITEDKDSGEFLFKQSLDGVWYASPLQVYLDLQGSEGRAKEMAENLRKLKIGF